MTQDNQAITLLHEVLDIHYGRDEVRKLLKKKEDESYSILMSKIDKFLNGKESEKKDIYGDTIKKT